MNMGKHMTTTTNDKLELMNINQDRTDNKIIKQCTNENMTHKTKESSQDMTHEVK